MKIGKLYNAGSINDYSQTVNLQQNNVSVAPDADSKNPAGGGTSRIRRSNKLSKVDLYRIIIAMKRLGCFVDESGNAPDDKKVFEAFGNMLGEDFSKYSNDLSQSVHKKNEADIFKRLEDAFKDYENEKLNKDD